MTHHGRLSLCIVPVLSPKKKSEYVVTSQNSVSLSSGKSPFASSSKESLRINFFEAPVLPLDKSVCSLAF
uniref:Uncharacterized protein n=1 Tax=Anguilla anguilla TaxID=7936 RepID=A0A0E9RTX8_ANGAN